MKEMKKNLILLGITLFVMILLSEYLIRVSIKNDNLWEFEEVTGLKHPANTVAEICRKEFCHKHTTNSDGFIDDEFSEDKKSKKIFMFGDSMIEAVQVDISNTTHRLLEKKLKLINTNFEVYNFGVSGHGPLDYFLNLKEYGRKYNPNLVIFNIYIKNDLRNLNSHLEKNYICRPFAELDNDTIKITPIKQNCSVYGRIIREYLKKSKLLVLIKRTFDNYKQEKQDNQEEVPSDFFVLNNNSKEFDKSFELNEKIISEAKTYSEELESNFLVVLLPAYYQADEQEWIEKIDAYPGLKTGNFDLNYPNKRILEFCEKTETNCLDLTPAFINYTKKTGKKLNFYYDKHWNEEGNLLAAEEILKHLLNENPSSFK